MNETKSGFVAIVGRPNVGKSSLLNRMVGEKVAIVSSKPQTTRTRINGILTQGDVQMVFVDTPGLHKPRTKLSEYMVRQVKESVSDVDVAVLVADCTEKEILPPEHRLMENFKARHLPAVLALNKIDLLAKKEELIPVIARFSEAFDFDAVVPVSAKDGSGVDELLQEILSHAKPGPHYYDEDDYTDQMERSIAEEIIREKLLQNLSDEIPHGTAVTIEEMKEREGGGLMDIRCNIYCEKESHKGIIIGKGGGMLKKIASEARADLEEFLQIQVNLQCWIKCKDDWRNKEGVIRTLGYK